jgi:mannosyltransferase
MHFWGDAFGFTPISLRIPSAIAVGLSAFLLFHLALKFKLSPVTATWASLIFIALPRTDMAGSEARSNALTATMAIALTYSFLWAIEKNPGWLRWLAFAGLLTASVYIFMFSALILVAFCLYLLVVNRAVLIRFAIASVIGLLLAAPVLYFGYSEKGQVGWISQKPIYQYLWEAIIAVDYNRNWPLAIVGIALCIFALVKRAPLVLGLWAMVPSALLILVSLMWQPYFVDHYLTFTTGGTAILAAFGISQIRVPKLEKHSPLIQWGVVIALIGLCVPSFIQSRAPIAKGTEWAQIAATIRENSAVGDGILLPDEVSKPARALDLMIVAYAPEFQGRIDLSLKTEPAATQALFGRRVREIDAPEPTSNRVLLVTDPSERNSVLLKSPAWLQDKFQAVKTISFETAQITIFDRIK